MKKLDLTAPVLLSVLLCACLASAAAEEKSISPCMKECGTLCENHFDNGSEEQRRCKAYCPRYCETRHDPAMTTCLKKCEEHCYGSFDVNTNEHTSCMQDCSSEGHCPTNPCQEKCFSICEDEFDKPNFSEEQRRVGEKRCKNYCPRYCQHRKDPSMTTCFQNCDSSCYMKFDVNTDKHTECINKCPTKCPKPAELETDPCVRGCSTICENKFDNNSDDQRRCKNYCPKYCKQIHDPMMTKCLLKCTRTCYMEYDVDSVEIGTCLGVCKTVECPSCQQLCETESCDPKFEKKSIEHYKCKHNTCPRNCTTMKSCFVECEDNCEREDIYKRSRCKHLCPYECENKKVKVSNSAEQLINCNQNCDDNCVKFDDLQCLENCQLGCKHQQSQKPLVVTTNCGSQCVKQCYITHKPDTVLIYQCLTNCTSTCRDFRNCGKQCFIDTEKGECAHHQSHVVNIRIACNAKMPKCLLDCVLANGHLKDIENGLTVDANDDSGMAHYQL